MYEKEEFKDEKCLEKYGFNSVIFKKRPRVWKVGVYLYSIAIPFNLTCLVLNIFPFQSVFNSNNDADKYTLIHDFDWYININYGR